MKITLIKDEKLLDSPFLFFRNLGIFQTLIFKGIRGVLKLLGKFGFPVMGMVYPVYIKNLAAPVYCRYGTSDDFVLYQIFLDEEYSPICTLENPKLILDCGANVGYAAIYFLNKYPQAKVIAVEPDPGNLEMCRKNLAPYGDRARIIPSAVWCRETGLILEKKEEYCEEWGIQVREAEAGENPDLIATDIMTLLEESGYEHIDLLKVDIEEAETVVFAENYRPWLDRVSNLAVEVHEVPGDHCQQAVQGALSHYEAEVWKSRETTFAKGLTLKAS